MLIYIYIHTKREIYIYTQREKVNGYHVGIVGNCFVNLMFSTPPPSYWCMDFINDKNIHINLLATSPKINKSNSWAQEECAHAVYWVNGTGLMPMSNA